MASRYHCCASLLNINGAELRICKLWLFVDDDDNNSNNGCLIVEDAVFFGMGSYMCIQILIFSDISFMKAEITVIINYGDPWCVDCQSIQHRDNSYQCPVINDV